MVEVGSVVTAAVVAEALEVEVVDLAVVVDSMAEIALVFVVASVVDTAVETVGVDLGMTFIEQLSRSS